MTDRKPDAARDSHLASLIVVATGVLWGFYWIPVRQLDQIGLAGAWGSFAIVAAATILFLPVAIARRHAFRTAGWPAILAIAAGGAAFVLYSIGLVYGRVAIIILLFFLTPVWSTLIGRFVMGWPVSGLRIATIVVGLAGLGIMLGAKGQIPIPRGVGEWLALISGILWSIATTAIRTRSALAAPESAFVFALGASIGAALIAPLLEPFPHAVLADALLPILGWTIFAGGLWWGVSMAALMWATSRLEPARLGILLMTEVLVGAVSAALIAGETLGPLEILGGALVLAAGVLEVWPKKEAPQPSAPSGR